MGAVFIHTFYYEGILTHHESGLEFLYAVLDHLKTFFIGDVLLKIALHFYKGYQGDLKGNKRRIRVRSCHT